MTKSVSEDAPLRLSGKLTVRTIEAPCARLREALSREASVLIDCSGAEEIDVSLIQLLLAARREGGERVRLTGPMPEVLAAALRRGGFLAPGSSDIGFWKPELEGN